MIWRSRAFFVALVLAALLLALALWAPSFYQGQPLLSLATGEAPTLVAVCDTAGYVLDVLHKYTGIGIYTDYRRLMDETTLDAVIIATPSRFHGEMVRAGLGKKMLTGNARRRCAACGRARGARPCPCSGHR